MVRHAGTGRYRTAAASRAGRAPAVLAAAAAVLLAVWAWLFYVHYWQAGIPAFGPVEAHVAELRRVFWSYAAAGALLALVCAGSLLRWVRAARRRGAAARAQTLPSRVRVRSQSGL